MAVTQRQEQLHNANVRVGRHYLGVHTHFCLPHSRRDPLLCGSGAPVLIFGTERMCCQCDWLPRRYRLEAQRKTPVVQKCLLHIPENVIKAQIKEIKYIINRDL
jgi:hypothetical protein